MKPLTLLLGTFLLTGCIALPKGVTPVEHFEVERYLGTWYEIARLDHRFERGLSKVTAIYSRRSDDGIDVLNRGWDERAQRWKEARGRAYFIAAPDVGRLKVTFFWPFYGGYNVIELDREGYSYALVCGPGIDYLWILSRAPSLDPAITDMLVRKAARLGFDTEALIYVDHQD